MPLFLKLLRTFLFALLLVNVSGCCCCDPGVLEEFGAGLQEGLEEESAAQTEKLQKQMKELAKQGEKAKTKKSTTAKGKKKSAKKLRKSGSFVDKDVKAKELNKARLALDVDAKPGVVFGRFQGTYYGKPFDLTIEGGLSAKSNAIDADGKDDAGEDNVSISATHEGDHISATIDGELGGRPIHARAKARRE